MKQQMESMGHENMNYFINKKAEMKTSKWTGGDTTQLGIFPSDGSYLNRDFVWRLSTATCNLEESTFSKLPDFDRVLMVLEGEVVLAHQDVRVAKLGELEQDSFDGGYITKSFGKITDYNLMVSKGNRGTLEAITLGETPTALTENYGEGYNLYTTSFFCKGGFATVSFDGSTVMLQGGDQLVIELDEEEVKAQKNLKLSVMGEGTLVRAEILYNYVAEEMRATYIPRERATFDDYLTCLYLSNIQFRGAKYIFKKLKTQWFDEELSSAIRKIESVYVTFFVGMLLAVIVGFLGINKLSPGLCALAVIGAIIFDIFIISPLIYLAVMPKPTRAHIKDINNLTPYEEKVREMELGNNERLNKIMKKYKNSGKVIDEIMKED